MTDIDVKMTSKETDDYKTQAKFLLDNEYLKGWSVEKLAEHLFMTRKNRPKMKLPDKKVEKEE